MTPRRVRWLAAVAWMGLIFIVSAQPDLPHPASGLADWLLSSGAHLAEYAVLGGLLAWALGERRAVWAAGLACLYALSDELHQAFVPGRTPDPVDLLCDALGAGLGVWLWAAHRGKGT